MNDETKKEKPQNLQPSDVQLIDGYTKKLDLNGAMAELFVNAMFINNQLLKSHTFGLLLG